MLCCCRFQTSNVRHTKSQILNVSCLVFELSLLNPLTLSVKSTGDVSNSSEWSTMLLPTKVRLILEVWGHIDQDKFTGFHVMISWLECQWSYTAGYELASTWTWWRHQMEAFSALLALCAGNSSVLVEFPTQRPVTRSFDVFFDLRLNKRLSRQSWGW